MKKSTIKLIALVFAFYILYFILLPSSVYADTFNIGDKFGYGKLKSLGTATDKLVVPLFSIAGTLVVIYFLLGAFDWIRSEGNKEAVEKARKQITNSIVGFILLMFAFLVIQFILHVLLGATNINVVNF